MPDKSRKQTRKVASPSRVTSSVTVLPAPTGLNLVDSPGALKSGECLVLTNIIRSELGARSRSGYRDHYNTYQPVRTIIGFEHKDALRNKLFAVTRNGIHDATSVLDTENVSLYEPAYPRVYVGDPDAAGIPEGDLPVTPPQTYPINFPNVDAFSGYGSYHSFTTQAGYQMILYADEANGYYVYNQLDSGEWAKMTTSDVTSDPTGLDPGRIAFVTVWKHRVIVVEKDSTTAYVFATDAYKGEATPIYFGPQFRHGGHLVGLWSWTQDGGAGIDDYLVGLSSAGDVVVWQGTNPDGTEGSFGLKGVWYVGALPAGRRCATTTGGELFVMSSMGLFPMSKLTAGSSTMPNAETSITHKISPAINAQMVTLKESVGWATQVHPEDSAILILVPDGTQWSGAIPDGGWSKLTGLSMLCAESYRGKLYFGTEAGKVCINDGGTDDRSGTPTAIDTSLVMGHMDGGAGEVKRLLMARPRFLNFYSTPDFQIEGRVNFSRTEAGAVQTGMSTSSRWDVAHWDSGVWGEVSPESGEWRGISGYGTYISIAMRMKAYTKTMIAGFDLLLDKGGIG